jgi:hypothetical protein
MLLSKPVLMQVHLILLAPLLLMSFIIVLRHDVIIVGCFSLTHAGEVIESLVEKYSAPWSGTFLHYPMTEKFSYCNET